MGKEHIKRWEGGSCLGTHVRIKDFKIKKNKKLKKKKRTHQTLFLPLQNKQIINFT